MSHSIDLGQEHTLDIVSWAPERHIQANSDRYADIPDEPRIGFIFRHVLPDGRTCEASGMFDCRAAREVFPHRNRWIVESWEPLTCSPSFVCTCGDHGWIRDGKWVPA